MSQTRLTAAEWTAMLRDPTRDKRYLSTQLGGAVADYLSWKENEDGAAARTLDSYERDLARLSVTLPLTAAQVSTDDLRLARDTYPKGSRYKVTAVYRDFFRWLYEEGRIERDPASRLRFPKKEQVPLTDLFSDEEKAAIVTAQETLRDRACVLLLLRAGLRKGELRHLRVREVNLAERYVLIYRGKGGKSRRVPIRGAVVDAVNLLLLEDVPKLGRRLQPAEYLLYPTRAANQHGRGDGPAPWRPMADSTAHRWWYACLGRAGIVEKGATSGRRTHTTRHTYATDLGRATRWNMLAVQKNLGHARIATTIDTYTQFAFEDQEAAVDALAELEGV